MPLYVDENTLQAFRARYLSPDFLLDAVANAPGRVVVASVPVGAGKSVAADGILLSLTTRLRYDLTVYLAPTWKIIQERSILRGANVSTGYVVLHPRPRAQCGPLDPEWRRCERWDNTAVGRNDICPLCDYYEADEDPCPWPGRFDKDRWDGVGIVFAPEEHLHINRNFVSLIKAVSGAKRILLILDECQIAGASFELVITPRELAYFRVAVADAANLDSYDQSTWLASMDTFARADTEGLADAGWRFPAGLNGQALAVQRAGLAIARDFRYLGYDLALFPGSKREERFRGDDGRVRFTARPLLDVDVLILSAHLRPEYVAHRLGLEDVAAPFEGLRVTHSGTRAFNLKNAIGMKRYFPRNAPQILAFVAVLLVRNTLLGRTTVLVATKDTKAFCARELTALLASLPLPSMRFVTEDYDALAAPDPLVTPIIHYGMVGVNTFEHYQSCYCLNSFYVPGSALDESLQGHEPDRFVVPVQVRLDAAGNRHVVVTDPMHAGSGLDRLGDIHLRKLEVDPALQAVGRVRFFTRPREVLFFALHDLAPEVEAVELRSLEAARAAFGVPRFKELQTLAATVRLKKLIAAGMSLADAATEVGVHRETARLWLRQNIPLGTFAMAFSKALEAQP